MKYTRELARIKATQYRQRIARYGREAVYNTESVYNTEPVSFEKWFLIGIRTHEAKGAEFELLPGMIKITWPGRVALLRSVEDFKREYKNEYLREAITA
jgi:hypothetical protein